MVNLRRASIGRACMKMKARTLSANATQVTIVSSRFSRWRVRVFTMSRSAVSRAFLRPLSFIFSVRCVPIPAANPCSVFGSSGRLNWRRVRQSSTVSGSFGGFGRLRLLSSFCVSAPAPSSRTLCLWFGKSVVLCSRRLGGAAGRLTAVGGAVSCCCNFPRLFWVARTGRIP